MSYLNHILFDTPLVFMLVWSAIFVPTYFGLTYLIGAWSWEVTATHLLVVVVFLFFSLSLTNLVMTRLVR